MEKWKAIKERIPCISYKDFENLIKTSMTEFQRHLQTQQQQIEDSKRNVKESMDTLKSYENQHDTKIMSMKTDMQTLIKYKQDVVSLETSLKDVKHDNQKLETKTNELKLKKVSKKDLELLENGRIKYRLYKDFTGIRWNYAEAESGFVKGYITEKKEYVQSFYYRSDTRNLSDKMWHEIETSVKNCIESMNENLLPNK